MTEDRIVVRGLLEKGSDAGFRREMIGFAARRPMELETASGCGAGMASAAIAGPTNATAIGTATGRRGPGPIVSPGVV